MVQSPADADLLIAQTAIGLAELHSVVVVAEYTDVFVLLLHYLNVDKYHDIYFQTKKALLSLSDVNSSLTLFVKNPYYLFMPLVDVTLHLDPMA